METVNIPTQAEADQLARTDIYIEAAETLYQASLDQNSEFYFARNIMAKGTPNTDWLVIVRTASGTPDFMSVIDWVESWAAPLRESVDEETFDLQEDSLAWALKYRLAQKEFESSVRAIGQQASRSYEFRKTD